MHEMSIAEGILDAALKPELADNEVVTAVRVAVGELAGVDIEALLFAWTSVRRGTRADSAQLVIERPAGRAWCMACAKDVPLHRHGDPCPECGGYQLFANQGHELQVLDLEIETLIGPGTADS